MKKGLKYILPILLVGLCWWYLSGGQEDSWKIKLEGTATSSSCRTVELTGDDVLDIVIGAGAQEHQASDNGVIGIDGNDGSILWKVPCRDQVVGSAIFDDVTADGIDDVFIGGRKNQLWCINGATGEVIWEFQKSIEDYEPQDLRVLNFFNPQFVPDQDGDRYQDILISFGGFVYAEANDDNRPPGKLMVISGKTGKTLMADDMPDGMETYFSPLVYDFRQDGDPFVIFGSGGETIEGGLYIIRLSLLMEGKIKTAHKLSRGFGRGYISPPVITDVTQDGVADIVVNSFNGRVLAFDGASFELIWENRIGYQVATFSSLAPVDITNDGVVDFFGTYGVGIWNDYEKTTQVIIDGKTGKELSRYNYGNYQYSSPVVADITGDGKEDVLLQTNTTKLSNIKQDDGSLMPIYSNRLIVFDLHNDKVLGFGNKQKGSNLLSTPLVIDLDNDGQLDVVSICQSNENNIHGADNLIIQREELPIQNTNPVKWGSYMGANNNSVY